MKKLMTTLGIGALALLAGCGNAADDTAGKTVTAWAWDPMFNIRALEIASDFYHEENPDSKTIIDIQESAQDDIVARLNIMLSSGVTNDLPNIVLIEDYRAAGFLQAFPNMFYPLGDYINSADFAPYKNAATSSNGIQYGIPFDTGVTGLFVRTDYLEAAGYTVEDMMYIDWNDFIRIGVDVYEATGRYLTTLDPSDLGQIRVMLQSVGSWYTEEDGFTPNLSGNEYLYQAFEIYKDLFESGVTMPVTTWGAFVGAFNGGDVWTVLSGNWITPSVASVMEQSGLWALVPTPRMPEIPGAVNSSNWGGSSWYVLDIDGKEAAAEFVANTFGSNAEFYNVLLEEMGAMGSFIPAKSGDAYQLEVEFFGGQQIYSDFAEWTALIPEVNFGLHTYAIEGLLAVAMQSYLNGEDLQTAIATAQTQAETQLN